MLRALVIALLVAAPLHAIDLPREKEKWISLDAGDFTLFSTAGERETKEVATNLLRMRDAVGKITRLKTRTGIPTHVYLFRGEGSFAPYRGVLMPENKAGITGIFFAAADVNFILLQGGSSGDVGSVVYHELAHSFVNNTSAGLPLWFNEGLAEYYSTFAAHGSDVSIGRPIPHHVQWLRNTPLIPLRQLFAIDSKSKEYNERSRVGAFYAQSWALTHYLLTERRDQLKQFLVLLDARKPTEEAFRGAFGVTYEQMEQELKTYVRKPTFTFTRYTLDELPVPALAAAKPMTRDDVLYRLGDLLARGGEAHGAADAQRHFTEAVRVNPSHAAAHAGLGMVLASGGREAEAIAAFEKAVQLGSPDPYVYLVYGTALLDKREMARARPLFEKAVQLAPGSARAWAGLGATYMFGNGDEKRGIEALQKSLELAPGQTDVAYHLVQFYANAGRRDDAQRLVEGVIAVKGDAELLARSRDALLIADVRRAENLFQRRKDAEAIAILKTVQTTAVDPAMKAHVTRVLASAEATAALNAAVELANSGKYKEAVAAIDKLLPTLQDAQMREHAQKFRDELAKAVKK